MTDLMECGHTAQGIDADGKPVCVICVGIHPGATVVVTEDARPSLEGRRARCSYFRGCKSEVDSSYSLAFFSLRPDQRYDDYYCGCRGWS